MERLDPIGDPQWDDRADDKKHFYRLCVEAIFQERPEALASLR
jgi:hypothetical protein